MKYTHYYEAYDSSVIDQVWYNANDQKMVVGLLNGTLCGYEGVSLPLYEAFTKQEDLGGSIGSYWNNFIKKGLAGFDTSGLEDEEFIADVEDDEEEELIAQAPVADETDWRKVLDDYFAAAGIEDNTKATDVDLNREVDMIGDFERDQINKLNDEQTSTDLPTWEVDFTFENSTSEFTGSLFVFGADSDEALDKFYDAAETLGYAEVEVKALTQHFG